MRLENINIEIVTGSIDRALDIIRNVDPKQFRGCESMTIRIIDSGASVLVGTNVDDAKAAETTGIIGKTLTNISERRFKGGS